MGWPISNRREKYKSFCQWMFGLRCLKYEVLVFRFCLCQSKLPDVVSEFAPIKMFSNPREWILVIDI